MKKTLCLLPFLLFGIIKSEAQQIDAEHQRKAEKIIQSVAAGKTLPAEFTEGLRWEPETTSPHIHSLIYWGKRTVNGQLIDKVTMMADIDDSLNSILFTEGLSEISDTLPIYRCNIEKGELTWAFTSKLVPHEGHANIKFHGGIPDLIKDIERHDTTPVIDIYNSLELKDKVLLDELKERNPKAVAFYEPKLLKSIDELYDMLFK